ncbi:hypothetical protein CO661_32920 [Sinorhizobium fredii]|uniref:Uncharacterized protein n=1 Tax=Rhizobium fredii TaxID=380 RepID=A0A2A6LNC4_RHIFR|nr:hypothetical protein [Sinorhizobium fredii]PDT43820.1 hypothetical protein CO661_32920 [Sinorhizobium fredii]
MQLRLISAIFIFVGSYLPLSLILLAQNVDYTRLHQEICWKFWQQGCSLPLNNPGFALGIFGACTLCFIVTLVALTLVQPKHEIQLTDVKHVPADLMNYTLPYVVSFMSIDYQETGKFVGFLIFLGWMFWITYRSGQIILNPILIAFGWRLYDLSYRFVGDTTEHSSNAFAYGAVATGERHRQVAIQDILIVKPNRNMED